MPGDGTEDTDASKGREIVMKLTEYAFKVLQVDMSDFFDEHMAKLTGITISSDAFFPFRDNIDTCAKFGVKYIVQPGGSVADDKVTEACDQYDMVQSHHGMRLFHH